MTVNMTSKEQETVDGSLKIVKLEIEFYYIYKVGRRHPSGGFTFIGTSEKFDYSSTKPRQDVVSR